MGDLSRNGLTKKHPDRRDKTRFVCSTWRRLYSGVGDRFSSHRHVTEGGTHLDSSPGLLGDDSQGAGNALADGLDLGKLALGTTGDLGHAEGSKLLLEIFKGLKELVLGLFTKLVGLGSHDTWKKTNKHHRNNDERRIRRREPLELGYLR